MQGNDRQIASYDFHLCVEYMIQSLLSSRAQCESEIHGTINCNFIIQLDAHSASLSRIHCDF